MTRVSDSAAQPGAVSRRRRGLLAPTLRKQCWGFMIGSSLFALGSAPWISVWMGAANANICFFVGAWFFTGAGLIQLVVRVVTV